MKDLRRELKSAILVLGITVAIGFAFPFSAIGFHPQPSRPSPSASAAFVVLTAEERIAALKAAKTAWQSEAPEKLGPRLRLPLGELPEEEQDTLIRACELLPDPVACEPVASRLPPWEPSRQAARPARLQPEADLPPPPAFSRDELLDLH